MGKMFGKNNTRHQRGGVSKQLLLLLVSFLTGYLSASIFDITSASNWFNTHILAQQVIPKPKQNTTQQVNLPKPKFEFYTMLANEQSATPAVQSQVAPLPAATSSNTMAVSPVTQTSTTSTAPMDLAVTKSAPVTAKVGLLANNTAGTKGMYMLQVAAFKNRLDAEHVKASLALKGFAVRVVSVSQQQTVWYRVLVGPFSTREEAQRVQTSVAQSEHIMGIVRKLDT